MQGGWIIPETARYQLQADPDRFLQNRTGLIERNILLNLICKKKYE